MIKDINPNSKIELTVIIKRVLQGIASNNNSYLNLMLQDNTGTISARIWDVKPQDLEDLTVGKIITIVANSLVYNNELQLKIVEYKVLTEKEAEKHYSDLIISAPINVEKEWEMIIKTIEGFNDQILKKILLYLLKKYKQDFIIRPAAVRMHHSVRSGLLWHSATMLALAKDIVKIYHDRNINCDLLYAGVIMHDFGKIWELNSHLITSFTLEGSMEGHIVLGSEQIKIACQQLKIDQQESSVVLLQHLILASHGKYEYGSPVLPKTIEAEILHHIDNLDAKITIIDDALKLTSINELTNRLASIEGRNFYKHYENKKK